MKRSTAISLNRRLLRNVEKNTTDSVGSEMVEPAEAFVCPDRHAQERFVLFYETPQPVAFSGECFYETVYPGRPPGDIFGNVS